MEIEAQILEWEFQFIKEKKKVRKKERKHAFDQENDQKRKETGFRPRKQSRKNEKR